MMIDEGLLQRVQGRAGGQSFHSADRAALGLHRKHQTGTHRVTVDDHRAGAAHTMLAAQVSAGEATVLAQCIGERAPRLGLDVVGFLVHLQSDGLFHGSFGKVALNARSSALRTQLSTSSRR